MMTMQRRQQLKSFRLSSDLTVFGRRVNRADVACGTLCGLHAEHPCYMYMLL